VKNTVLLLLFLSMLILSSGVTSQPNYVNGIWPDGDQYHGIASAAAHINDNFFMVSHSLHSPTTFHVPITRKGILDIDRVDLGLDSAMYLVSGYDSTSGTGFVQYVTHSSYIFQPAIEIWSQAGNVAAGVGYSPMQLRLYAVDTTASLLLWRSFDPFNPTVAPWNTIPIDLTGLVSPQDITVSILDDTASSMVEIFLMPTNPILPGVVFRVDSSPVVTNDVLDPVAGYYNISGSVKSEVSTVCAFGAPGATLEVFSRISGEVFGFGTIGSSRTLDIPVSTIPVGDIVSVRPQGTMLNDASQRFCFKSWGTSESIPNVIDIGPFGREPATSAQVNNPDFSVFFIGTTPAGAPTAFSAWALVGVESDIQYDPQHNRYILTGPNVVGLPTILDEEARGDVLLPIPDDDALAGGRFCLQWLVVHNSTLAYSNIACVMIQPRDSATGERGGPPSKKSLNPRSLQSTYIKDLALKSGGILLSSILKKGG
jgi:hypothetical protein